MDAAIPSTQETDSQADKPLAGYHSRICRKPAGRKPKALDDLPPVCDQLRELVRHCWPDFNRWLNDLPDPRLREMCRYSGAHLWWTVILVFLTRGESRNAFDGCRHVGFMPENVESLCGQAWDEARLGEERTVTCTQNAVHHAGRVDPAQTGRILPHMVRRLMEMRALDAGRLFGTWWRIAVDATLQQRNGRRGCKKWRMALEARLIGPCGLELPLMVEFLDVHNPVRDKLDCELNGFDRLSRRLKNEFPRLPICLLLDGLYAVKPVFDRCKEYGWKYIVVFKEGRQPAAFDEAAQIMGMSRLNLWKGSRRGENGPIEQTARWAEDVPVSGHRMNVIFMGEIAPHAATLWAWATNFRLDPQRIDTIVNEGGRARFRQEENFNVLKNNGYGLEHAFCTQQFASKNFHVMLLVADTLWQVLADGVLARLKHLARKLTDIAFVRMMFSSMLCLPPSVNLPRIGQIRFTPG